MGNSGNRRQHAAPRQDTVVPANTSINPATAGTAAGTFNNAFARIAPRSIGHILLTLLLLRALLCLSIMGL